ncbi:HEAT repeat domain-containing protein [Pseudanabaena sp. Chao 1811]|uniref:HEAT repeat domain-containing protein n=1 Tax=Pseudanabaena sp. Chao 1811 TaxID=2963092 RepID=UPI0022F3D696|nr:HEAT repeat domain-containing protein [Pseudanabaena sp. Chao 1811]
MSTEICFDGYLKSLVSKYERSQDCYTQTDATDLFDFGLMVQTLEEKNERQESQNFEPEKPKIETFPVLDGIRKYASEKVLLVGKPGSGKSTALQKMLVDEAQKVIDGEASLIPVLIELRSWRTSYLALIKDFFRAHKLRLDEETIDALLFEGKLLLLVDGVNELPADDHARQDILTLRETNPDTPMIFTTRMLGVGGDLGIEKKLEMLPLNDSQMRQFVHMRLPEQGNQMLQQLGNRLRQFGDTPLLLSMLCDVFKINGRVPANLGSAFRDFANLYDGKLKEHIPVSEQSRSWWSKLLPQLAFAMMPQDRPDGLRLSMPRSESVDILTQFLEREKFDKPRDYAQQWLKDLLKHHLIQVKLVGTNEEIEFRHQLIQEYYAAEYLLPLLPNLSDLKLQHSYLNYLDWTESLALMLELVESEEQAVRVVRLALEVDLRLGARLAGAVKYGFQEKTVGLLMKEIDERKIPQVSAIDILGTTMSEIVFEPLAQILQDSNNSVSQKAAKMLGMIGNDKVVEHLMEYLIASRYYRMQATDALVRINSNKVVEILAPYLQQEASVSSEVSSHVILILSKIGSDKAVESLSKVFNDFNNLNRWNAAWALAKIGSDKAIETLIQALKDSDDFVRWKVAEILGNISDSKAIETLIQALKDSDDFVRWKVAEILGNIGGSQAVDALIQSLKDSNDFVLRKVTESLGRIGNDRAVEPLIEILKDSNNYVRWYVVDALGEIGSDKAIQSLVHILNESHDYVRRNIVDALEIIRNNNVVDPLVQRLDAFDDFAQNNNTVFVQNNIIEMEEILDMVERGSAFESAIDSLDSSNKFLYGKLAKALGEIGNKKAVEPLIRLLKNSDDYLRRNVVEALGKIGSDKAVDALIQLLND